MSTHIHFAHGNGFPSPCYRQLLTALESRFNIGYIDRIGHSQDYPVTENWHCLVDELVASVQMQCKPPVIAVGHSLGGVLSFRAAAENPGLFSAVVLLDSPILGRFKSRLLKLSKALRVIDHITPASQSKGRRASWATREDALHYLKGRKLFRHFTDECLEDYIDYGMQKGTSGYTLRFDTHIEYQIYRTVPHMLHRYEGKVTVPVFLIHGSHSNVIHPADVRYMKKQYGITSFQTAGSHMFPMEHPSITADLVIKAIESIS